MTRPAVLVLLLLVAFVSLTTARSRPLKRTLGKAHKGRTQTKSATSQPPDGEKNDDDIGMFQLSIRKGAKGSPKITVRLSNGTDAFLPGTGQLSSKEGLTIDLQNLNI